MALYWNGQWRNVEFRYYAVLATAEMKNFEIRENIGKSNMVTSHRGLVVYQIDVLYVPERYISP